MAKTLESETHCSEEKEVLATIWTEPSLALTDATKFVNEAPNTVRENEAEVAPFWGIKLDNTGVQ